MKTYYFDVDGVLADFHSRYNHKNRAESLTYDFIRNLDPFMENIRLVKRLIAEGHRVYISTKVANKFTAQARKDWLAEYLPEIPKYRVIVVMSGAKSSHMRTKDGILVDDRLDNCKEWIKNGHQAIWVQEKGGSIDL